MEKILYYYSLLRRYITDLDLENSCHLYHLLNLRYFRKLILPVIDNPGGAYYQESDYIYIIYHLLMCNRKHRDTSACCWRAFNYYNNSQKSSSNHFLRPTVGILKGPTNFKRRNLPILEVNSAFGR